MSAPHYSAIAARLLRRAPAPLPTGSAERARGFETIQRALAARQRQRRLWHGALAAGLVAAAALVVVGLRGASSAYGWGTGKPEVSVSALEGSRASVVDSAQHRAALKAGTELSTGSRIETAAGGGAALRLSTGTELKVDGESRLTLQARGSLQHFSLKSGGLQASVAKLGPGERFVVETPDAQVEVRGTRFHVSVLPAAQSCLPETRTRLEVQEGVVEVRWSGQVVQVRAGEIWPQACAAAAVAEEQPVPPLRPSAGSARLGGPAARAASHQAVAAGAESPTVPHDRSSTVIQLELFAQASKAARLGDVATALGLFQELAQTYPSSALAENAVAERMRLLRRADPGAAKREAARYLKLYPGGFGKSEAEHILAAP